MSSSHITKTNGDITLGIPNASLGLQGKGGSTKQLGRDLKSSSMGLK